jgi:periplasmic protein TonB
MTYFANILKFLLIITLVMLHFYMIKQWVGYFASQLISQPIAILPPLMINLSAADLPIPSSIEIATPRDTKIATTPKESVAKSVAHLKKATVLPAKTEKVTQVPKRQPLRAPRLPQKIPTLKPPAKPTTQSIKSIAKLEPKSVTPPASVKKSPISDEKPSIAAPTTSTSKGNSTSTPVASAVQSRESIAAISSTSGGSESNRGGVSKNSANLFGKSTGSAPSIVKKSQPYTPPNHHAAYLHNPKPLYPQISQQLEEQGTVHLLVTVNPRGQVNQVQIKRSCGYPRLDSAALQAVRQWQFIPAKQGDNPITAITIVPIVFKLSEE